MTQSIVPALPLERVRYERAYVLGLEAMMSIIHQLSADQTRCSGLVDQFPVFSVSYNLVPATMSKSAIEAAVARLAVQPTELFIGQRSLTLQFALQTPAGKPVWLPTTGALWRLYDGFLTNLTRLAFNDISAVQVRLKSVVSGSVVTRPLRPSFQDYQIIAPATMRIVSGTETQMLPVVTPRHATIYQLRHYLNNHR